MIASNGERHSWACSLRFKKAAEVPFNDSCKAKGYRTHKQDFGSSYGGNDDGMVTRSKGNTGEEMTGTVSLQAELIPTHTQPDTQCCHRPMASKQQNSVTISCGPGLFSSPVTLMNV